MDLVHGQGDSLDPFEVIAHEHAESVVKIPSHVDARRVMVPQVQHHRQLPVVHRWLDVFEAHLAQDGN